MAKKSAGFGEDKNQAADAKQHSPTPDNPSIPPATINVPAINGYMVFAVLTCPSVACRSFISACVAILNVTLSAEARNCAQHKTTKGNQFVGVGLVVTACSFLIKTTKRALPRGRGALLLVIFRS
jgi:hypothetical protein